MLLRALLFPLAFSAALPASAATGATDPPEGLACPDQVAAAVLLDVGGPTGEAGVIGYCIYYLEEDEDPDVRNVTVTLSLADATYDYQKSFKAPKLEGLDTTVVSEGTQTVPYGSGTAEAATVVTRNPEPDQKVTDSFDALWVVKRSDGRVVTVEEEYTNATTDMVAPLREALLKAQSG